MIDELHTLAHILQKLRHGDGDAALALETDDEDALTGGKPVDGRLELR